jgi:hypothetical protein
MGRILDWIDRDVIEEVRPVTRVEDGVQVGYLEVSLLPNNGIDEMSLVDDDREVRTNTISGGPRTISFETGRDVEGGDLLDAGNYTFVSRSDGQVVSVKPITLEKEVEVANVELGRRDKIGTESGVKTFRFDIVNVGDPPIDFEEGYVT